MLKERRQVSAEQKAASRTDRVRAGPGPVTIPRLHIASYVRSVVAELKPKPDATFDQHA
jgi:hypothetical protein